MAISGSVSSVSQIKGSISQGNELVVTRVAVPGPQGPQGASGSSENKVLEAQDVVTTGIADGALLQFRASDQKFVARNTLDTTSGTLVFSGGSF